MPCRCKLQTSGVRCGIYTDRSQFAPNPLPSTDEANLMVSPFPHYSSFLLLRSREEARVAPFEGFLAINVNELPAIRGWVKQRMGNEYGLWWHTLGGGVGDSPAWTSDKDEGAMRAEKHHWGCARYGIDDSHRHFAIAPLFERKYGNFLDGKAIREDPI